MLCQRDDSVVGRLSETGTCYRYCCAPLTYNASDNHNTRSFSPLKCYLAELKCHPNVFPLVSWHWYAHDLDIDLQASIRRLGLKSCLNQLPGVLCPHSFTLELEVYIFMTRSMFKMWHPCACVAIHIQKWTWIGELANLTRIFRFRKISFG